MFGFGMGEFLLVLVIMMIVFRRRLPELGESLGKGVRKFRKAMNTPDEIDITPKNDSHEA